MLHLGGGSSGGETLVGFVLSCVLNRVTELENKQDFDDDSDVAFKAEPRQTGEYCRGDISKMEGLASQNDVPS